MGLRDIDAARHTSAHRRSPSNARSQRCRTDEGGLSTVTRWLVEETAVVTFQHTGGRLAVATMMAYTDRHCRFRCVAATRRCASNEMLTATRSCTGMPRGCSSRCGRAHVACRSVARIRGARPRGRTGRRGTKSSTECGLASDRVRAVASERADGDRRWSHRIRAMRARWAVPADHGQVRSASMTGMIRGFCRHSFRRSRRRRDTFIVMRARRSWSGSPRGKTARSALRYDVPCVSTEVRI